MNNGPLRDSDAINITRSVLHLGESLFCLFQPESTILK